MSAVQFLLLGTLTLLLYGIVRGCPIGCNCKHHDGEVNCSSGNLTSTPTTIPSTVVKLDLSNNSLEILSLSQDLPKLEQLILRSNRLEIVTTESFCHTKSLKIVDFSGNRISSLDDNVFRCVYQSLQQLDLSDNLIVDVGTAFDRLVELSRLDLRQNQLVAVNSGSFDGLTSLRYLRLDDNHIQVIEARAFQSLEMLSYLVVKGNPIAAIENLHLPTVYLSYVDMSECRLERVPRGLPATVRYLQLRRNRIRRIDREMFEECIHLGILVLDDNFIDEVEAGAFSHLEQLQQLWLTGNRQTRVPSRIPAGVQRLILDSNLIESLPEDSFPDHLQLSALSLMSNLIREIHPDVFNRLPELKSMDLSGNYLDFLPRGIFSKNTKLRTLQLSRNPIVHLASGCFSGLQILDTLSLTYIGTDTRIDDNVFDELSKLTKLDLDGSPGLASTVVASDRMLNSLSGLRDLGLQKCDLTHLRAQLFKFLPNLSSVRITSSRWHCDRSMIWFRDWLFSEETNSFVEMQGANRCLTPGSVRNLRISTLEDYQFVSITRDSFVTAGSTATWIKNLQDSSDSASKTNLHPNEPNNRTWNTQVEESKLIQSQHRHTKLDAFSENIDRSTFWIELFTKTTTKSIRGNDDSVYMRDSMPYLSDSSDDVGLSNSRRDQAFLSKVKSTLPSVVLQARTDAVREDSSETAVVLSNMEVIVIVGTIVTTIMIAVILISLIVLCSRKKHKQTNTSSTAADRRRSRQLSCLEKPSRDSVLYCSPKAAAVPENNLGPGTSSTLVISGGRKTAYVEDSFERRTSVYDRIGKILPAAHDTVNLVCGQVTPVRVYKWEEL